MNVERLAHIKTLHEGWPHVPHIREVGELLAHIDELTRQRDDARDKAISAGIFTSSDGDESWYTHVLNTDTCEGCGRDLWNGLCSRCETEISTPGATSYKP